MEDEAGMDFLRWTWLVREIKWATYGSESKCSKSSGTQMDFSHLPSCSVWKIVPKQYYKKKKYLETFHAALLWMDFLRGAVEENQITVQYVFHEELNFL